MKNFCRIICAAACMMSMQPSMACDYPPRVPVPDGRTAEKEEMLESVKAMKQWQEDLIAYRQCIEDENETSKAAIETSDPLEKEAQIAALDRQLLLKYNASVDEETKLGAEFNEQIKIYNNKKKN